MKPNNRVYVYVNEEQGLKGRQIHDSGTLHREPPSCRLGWLRRVPPCVYMFTPGPILLLYSGG
jgi:hypothetical protein